MATSDNSDRELVAKDKVFRRLAEKRTEEPEQYGNSVNINRFEYNSLAWVSGSKQLVKCQISIKELV